MKREGLFTSECVTEGHPDKVADAISDAILDVALNNDSTSRVACETMVTTGTVLLAGEITTSTYVDFPVIARDVIKSIGYDKDNQGFSYDGVGVHSIIDTQSPDIAQGVDVGGAGDNGMMFGGACKETPELMPLPITLARALTTRYTELIKDKTLPWGRPDGKSQVTVFYEDGLPKYVDTVVMCVQHTEDVSQDKIKEDLINNVINPVLESYNIPFKGMKVYTNPTGKFVIGGPYGDSGLTGRKIVVDNYGSYYNVGGGAFSGKDPTKVDRSAAYMARYIAKNLVAAGLFDNVEIQLSYAIGIADPVSISVDWEGGNYDSLSEEYLVKIIYKVFDMTPKGIIETLGLREPAKSGFSYSNLARQGHFGIEGLPWERTDKVEDIKAHLSKFI